MERETHTRCDQDAPASQGSAEAASPYRLYAVAVELHRNEVRLGCGAELYRSHDMIFQPTPNAEESEVMPLLHSEAEIAEKTQNVLGIYSPPQLPPEIEKVIHLVARNHTRFAQQFINHFQSAAPATGRRRALGRNQGGTDGRIHKVWGVQPLR